MQWSSPAAAGSQPHFLLWLAFVTPLIRGEGWELLMPLTGRWKWPNRSIGHTVLLPLEEMEVAEVGAGTVPSYPSLSCSTAT